MNLKEKKFAVLLLTITLACIFLSGVPQALAIDYGAALNPLGWLKPTEGNVIPKLIGQMILIVLGVTGSFALFMFVYGGFYLLTSAGGTDKITKGKKILTWAIIGIIIILTSYALVNFIITAIPEK
jgi:hypothetical protein